MRKLVSIAFVVAIYFSFAACGQSQITPLIEVGPEGKYFECSASEFLTLLNNQLQNSNLEGISFATEPNSNKQYVAGKTTYLKFDITNEDKVRSISLYWQNRPIATETDHLAAGAFMGFIPYCFGLNNIVLLNEFNAGDPSAESTLKKFPPVQVSFVQLDGQCLMKISPIFTPGGGAAAESNAPTIPVQLGNVSELDTTQGGAPYAEKRRAGVLF